MGQRTGLCDRLMIVLSSTGENMYCVFEHAMLASFLLYYI